MFKLTIPAFMGMFVMTLYNVIDTIFIGHYVGTLGIDGIWASFPVSDGLSFIFTLALLIPVWHQFRRLSNQSQKSINVQEESELSTEIKM